MMNPKPTWLKTKSHPEATEKVAALLSSLSLNTVCSSAACPNMGECFNNNTATFMILGQRCTRNCGFCNVAKENPEAVDPDEPKNVALAAKQLGLRHVVVTSVTRDDLPDGGGFQFAATIHALRQLLPDCTVEVLIPDFEGGQRALAMVVSAAPDVLNHNIETVPSLYSHVRPMANYQRSLNVLKNAKSLVPNLLTKSGIMLGLGETQADVTQVFDDLRAVGCDALTIGQYLRP
jgi:lipoic acid synthetase